MTSGYDSALRQQQFNPVARADTLVPTKNTLPLIVTSPYSHTMPAVIGLGYILHHHSSLCCDGYTERWLSYDTVCELTQNLPAIGITLLSGTFPRYRLDLDRKPNSINPETIDRPTTFKPDPNDIYATHGLGIVWTRVPGDTSTPLYIGDHQPTQKQIEAQIKDYYTSFHDLVKIVIANHMNRFGGSLHISLQPFSREEAIMLGADPKNIPHFVICDGDGKTSEPGFQAKLMHTLAGKGYDVRLNKFFPDGELIMRHAAPKNKAHSIQLKVFEDLYVDPNTLQPTNEFRKFARDLHATMMTMAEYAKTHIRKSQPSAEIKDMGEARERRNGNGNGNKPGPR